MAALAVIDTAVGIASLAVTLKDLNQYNGAQTQVQIAVGGSKTDGYLGGSVPHVQVFGEDGGRIGIYDGDANGHIDPYTVKNIVIDNKLAGGKDVQPEYLNMWMNEGDGICVAMIVAAGNGAEWSWFGDMGFQCGAQWYPSDFKLGSDTYTPRCIWFDSDHSDSIIARGINLHMPDFNGDPGRATQYNDFPETLCNSVERMQLLPGDDMDATVPYFNPPLEYNQDGSDKDMSRIVDRKGGLYPPTPKRRMKRGQAPPTKDGNSTSTTSQSQGKAKLEAIHRNNTSAHPPPKDRNLNRDHLVVSKLPHHSAKEVCEHPNAIGWDFVSVVEEIFCDITTALWYQLCSDLKKDGCFDLENKELRGNSNGTKSLHARDVGVGAVPTKKNYQTVKVFEHP